jgi:alkylhydroperoxidase family enzyme
MRLKPCLPIVDSICRLSSSAASCRVYAKEQIDMPRIPYKPIDLAKPNDIVDAIRLRRGGNLLNLDRMLLHSPAFAKGWNALLLEVRTGLALSPKLREIAMCVVAVLNGADYEFHHHAPELIKAGGTSAQVEALRHPLSNHDTALFDAAEHAAIQLTIEMTRNMQVSDATFSAIRAALSNEQHVVELVGVIATYNMVSRFLVALGVEPE